MCRIANETAGISFNCMAIPSNLNEAIEQALTQPKQVTENGRTVVNRDISELQDARDREAATTAKSKKNFGLRFTKLVPPGAG